MKNVFGFVSLLALVMVTSAFGAQSDTGAINQVTQNEDRSVTILNPRVQVAGQDLPVALDTQNESPQGTCKLKGFGAALDWLHGVADGQFNGEGVFAAFVSADGTIGSTAYLVDAQEYLTLLHCAKN